MSLLVVLLPSAWLVLDLRGLLARQPRSGVRTRARVGLAAGLEFAVALTTATLRPTAALGATLSAASSTGVCPAGAPPRSYDVRSINVNIPLNRFGDHDPKGRMYVLSSAAAARAEEATQKVSIGLRDDPIQPLFIRANEGDCLTINDTPTTDHRSTATGSASCGSAPPAPSWARPPHPSRPPPPAHCG